MDWTQVSTIGITAASTLAAGLGGAWFADRRSLQREALARTEAHADELRRVLSECIIDARALIDSEWVLIPVFSRMSNQDLAEFAETDSGKQIGERMYRLRNSLTAARLLVSPSSPLGSALADLQVLVDNLSDQAHDKVMGSQKSLAEKDEGVTEAFKYIRAMRRVTDAVEQEAIAELARIGRI